MAKVSRPFVYVVVVAVGASAYFMMGGEGAKPHSSVKAATRSSKGKKANLYSPEDYKASFARLSGGSKDAFTPVVSRGPGGGAVGPDVVPAEMALGDPNWAFTGSSEIDGAANALFENRVTLETEFAKAGERWKNCTVSNINEGYITLTSRTGRKVQLRLAEPADQAAQPGAPATQPNGFRPVNPALSGPIGGRQVAVRPEGSQAGARRRNAQEQNNAN